MRLNTLCAITLLLLSTQLKGVDFSQKDKQLHYFGSLVGQTGMYYSAQLIKNKPMLNTLLSGGVMLGAGYGWELYQKKSGKGVYNIQDFYSDAMGVASGMIINYVVDKYVFRRKNNG